LNGPAEVKAHPWIRNYPWEKLKNKELDPPFVPSVKTQRNLCNPFRVKKTTLTINNKSHKNLQTQKLLNRMPSYLEEILSKVKPLEMYKLNL